MARRDGAMTLSERREAVRLTAQAVDYANQGVDVATESLWLRVALAHAVRLLADLVDDDTGERDDG